MTGSQPTTTDGNARVLLISDERHCIDQVRAHLANAKSVAFQVVHVARIGLVEDSTDSKEPDVVLLDVDPRESRGIDLFNQTRAALPSIPIVAISAIDREDFAYELIHAGADGYLCKTELSPRTLVTALSHALETQSNLDLLNSSRQRELHLATHDVLTGLPNRALAMDRLKVAVAGARRSKTKLAVLFLDLDGFRSVNDALGQAVGDGLLRGISRRLDSCLREGDTAARLGGDEFCVILTQLRTESDAGRVATKILEALSKPIPFSRRPTSTTVSIGIATFPKDAVDANELLTIADTALHHAKGLGRNRFEYYQKSMKSAALRRLSVEAALQAAIDANDFRLHYQPQFDIRHGRIIGAEALIRWQHPDLGLVSPNRFLPIAEETGLIMPIGDWVLHEACRQNAEWQREGQYNLRISVNVASQQFQHPLFANSVRSALREFNLDPSLLELEITESSLLADVEVTTNTLQDLRNMGVRLAIDDFGTGYSSLAYLKRLPIHLLKIDQSFIRGLATDPDDATITQTIIKMAHGLRLSTIAEGVETFQQLLLLGSYGCHRMQGYLFGAPVEPETFLPWLTDPPFSWSKIQNERPIDDGAATADSDVSDS
jgi:diguanylate cyclase (GGDEF)-like protein